MKGNKKKSNDPFERELSFIFASVHERPLSTVVPRLCPCAQPPAIFLVVRVAPPFESHAFRPNHITFAQAFLFVSIVVNIHTGYFSHRASSTFFFQCYQCGFESGNPKCHLDHHPWRPLVPPLSVPSH